MQIFQDLESKFLWLKNLVKIDSDLKKTGNSKFKCNLLYPNLQKKKSKKCSLQKVYFSRFFGAKNSVPIGFVVPSSS